VVESIALQKQRKKMDGKHGKSLGVGDLNENSLSVAEGESRIGKDCLEFGTAVNGMKPLNFVSYLLFLTSFAGELEKRPCISAR
jgi:hypothetical protein